MKNHLNHENELSNGGGGVGGVKVKAITAANATNAAAKVTMTKKKSDYENHHKSPPLSKRLYSNSSGEYMDYLDKLRSISPIRRPAFLVKPPEDKDHLAPNFKLNSVILNEKANKNPYKNHNDVNENDDNDLDAFVTTNTTKKTSTTTSKKIRKFFNKKNKSTNTKCSMKNLKKPAIMPTTTMTSAATQTKRTTLTPPRHAPKIVIDSLYDEENELKLDNCNNDNDFNKCQQVNEVSSFSSSNNANELKCLNNNNRQFKLSSASSLLSEDRVATSDNNINDNDIVDVDYEQQENAHQIAYL
jgi:hypothetical protein